MPDAEGQTRTVEDQGTRSQPTPRVAAPVPYDIYFDPLAGTYGMAATKENAEAWPDEAEDYLRDVAREFFWHHRDRICWMVAAGRLHSAGINAFVARTKPITEWEDDVLGYFGKAFQDAMGLITDAKALQGIARAKRKPIWLCRGGAVRLGVAVCPEPLTRKIDLDRLQPYVPDVKGLRSKSASRTFAARSGRLVVLAVTNRYADTELPSEKVWSLADQQLVVTEDFDKHNQSVPLSVREAWMPYGRIIAKAGTVETELLAIFETAYFEGPDMLTGDQLRLLREFTIKRLREVKDDPAAVNRAIDKHVFPLARKLFPDEIEHPEEVTGKCLTDLFRARANPAEGKKIKPTTDQRELILDLTKAWRSHVCAIR
ncbi:hypothetical protein, partial [Stieleria magnilauensis]|uniref:hypothetical protein n=1 Tax=Stieleria magnilauensis TaxID=2527963 RepID=UPI003AF5835D